MEAAEREREAVVRERVVAERARGAVGRARVVAVRARVEEGRARVVAGRVRVVAGRARAVVERARVEEGRACAQGWERNCKMAGQLQLNQLVQGKQHVGVQQSNVQARLADFHGKQPGR